MFTGIISDELQYLKLVNCVPKLNYCYYIAILGTIWLYANKLIVLNSNTWNLCANKCLILNRIINLR